MDGVRVYRTLLHKRFGIFRYSAALEKCGISSPSEQMFAVGRFIEEGLGNMTKFPRLSDETAVANWMRDAIVSMSPHLIQSGEDLKHFDLLLLRTTRFLAWNPYREFAELLNFRCGAKAYSRAMTLLRSRGFKLGISQLSNLTEQFLLNELPDAIRRFHPSRGVGHEDAWLTKVFYRFALNGVISDRINQSHLEALQALTPAELTPEELLGKKEEMNALSSLRGSLEKLPPRERRALGLYFGFLGREFTLSEIGEELNVSEYLARSCIVHGLGTLATLMDIQGPLTDEEFNLLRLTLRDGVELKAAAKQLNISEKHAREIAGQTGRKFRLGLRSRTLANARKGEEIRKERIMSIQLMPDEAQIVAELKRLKSEPLLRIGSEGMLYAELGSAWVPAAHIRQIATAKEVVESLQKNNIPVGWLLVPDPTIDRPDLPQDAVEWAETLRELNRRSWITAESLYNLCKDRASTDKVTFLDENEECAIERIYRALAGVSQAAESVLPEKLRNKEIALFRIEMAEDNRAMAGWEDDPTNTTFDLTQLVQDQAELLGEMSSQASEVLANVLIDAMFTGAVTLPGFRRHKASLEKKIWLEWIEPVTSTQVNAIEQSKP